MARSATVGQPASTPDSALQAILGGLEGTPLRLREAVQYASGNATSIGKAEVTYLAAGGSVRREAGLFDPRMFFSFEYQDLRQPTSSFFSGAPILSTQVGMGQAGVRMNLPIGTEIELSLNTLRTNTNSEFAFLNPEYDAFGSIAFRQPLLGGFAASARKQLTKAERDLDAGKARYDQQVLVAGAAVELLYWDLYAAERDYAAQRLTRDRARAFLTEAELRAKTGLIGPNQVANARTSLAEQELLLIEREEQLDHQSDQLASMIGTRPRAGVSRFLTMDEPPEDVTVGPVDSLVETAMRNNLDLHAARKDVEANQALASAAGWEALPSVNLIGSLSGTGLAGSTENVIFNGDTLRIDRAGGFGDALSQVARRLFPGWRLGVEVSIPIGFRSGLGEKDRLEAQVLGAQQEYIEKARALEEQVRAACRELAHGRERLRAAREGVDAAA